MTRPLRVAIVGSGPSGMYAASHLVEQAAGTWADNRLIDLARGSVEVDVFDRLPTPWGLVRAGVAPDHPDKKRVTDVFDAAVARGGISFFGNVEVGRDITTKELSDWYDAVIFAFGACGGRTLSIPGAQLAGNWTGHEIVGWYNGHPDFAALPIDLSFEHLVMVGNGNVALDVARMLTRDPGHLATTDVDPRALEALRHSMIRTVTVLGRRGPAHASFGNAELLELEAVAAADGIDLVVDAADLGDPAGDAAHESRVRQRLRSLRRMAARPPAGHGKRIKLMFHTTPVEICGTGGHVKEILVRRTSPAPSESTDLAAIAADIVIASIGYRSQALDGLPFDHDAGVVPAEGHRVIGPDGVVPGAYVTGWVKRGPSGMIGTNKLCAREAVRSLLADADKGALPTAGTRSARDVLMSLQQRVPSLVTWAGWRRIDVDERRRGRAGGRPRTKITDVDALVALAHSRTAPS